MSRFRVERTQNFKRSLAERCLGFEKIEEYLKWLEWELERDPTLLADQLSEKWPRYARILGDNDVNWRCLVMWRVTGDKVLLEDIWPNKNGKSNE